MHTASRATVLPALDTAVVRAGDDIVIRVAEADTERLIDMDPKVGQSPKLPLSPRLRHGPVAVSYVDIAPEIRRIRGRARTGVEMSLSQRNTHKQNKLSLVKRRARGSARHLRTVIPTVALLVTFAQLPPAHAQSASTGATIEAAAEALGMVRGVRRQMDSINTVQFSGAGTMSVPESRGRWSRYELTQATIGISYYIPAMRSDLTRTDQSGSEQRTIHVVSGERAWDETQPGIGATPVNGQAADRRRQIWLTPHGIIRAAVEAEARNPGSVTVGMQAGKTTLTVEVDGTPIVATLNADSRPERVGMAIEHPVLGRTRLEAAYSDYVDWPLLDVYFPSRIVQTLGDQTTLDLTISAFFQNPYVVFPTPEQLARSSQ